MFITNLADTFRRFSSFECRGSSSLYEHLSEKISEDEELLLLASNARAGQPVPNLFLAAVHYLLLQGKQHELNEYYHSITEAHEISPLFFLTSVIFVLPIQMKSLISSRASSSKPMKSEDVPIYILHFVISMS